MDALIVVLIQRKAEETEEDERPVQWDPVSHGLSIDLELYKNNILSWRCLQKSSTIDRHRGHHKVIGPSTSCHGVQADLHVCTGPPDSDLLEGARRSLPIVFSGTRPPVGQCTSERMRIPDQVRGSDLPIETAAAFSQKSVSHQGPPSLLRGRPWASSSSSTQTRRLSSKRH